MKILVTGGAGMLGRAVARSLHQRGHAVTSFDLHECPEPGITSLTGDVRDASAVQPACAGMDAVIHTVAYVNQLPDKQPIMYDVNVAGTHNLIAACQAGGVPRLIYTSSVDVVFDGTPIRDGDETLPYPEIHLDYYGVTKMLGEQAVIAANSPTLATCSLRMAGLYGAYDRHRFPNVIPLVARTGTLTRIGDGKAKFNHVYVENAAHAFALAAEQLQPGNTLAGQCYFITDYAPDNFFTFFQPFLDALGIDYRVAPLPASLALLLARWGDFQRRFASDKPPLLSRYAIAATSRDFWFNHRKATRDFGYAPVVSQADAFQRTVMWAREALLKA